jgi:polyribonucleotide nucleotidyltransferase
VEVGLLPRAHGTGLFTRGQTQALTVATLGPSSDIQRIDTISPETEKHYLHHYNFPPYSTGENKPMRGPSRRDIGHGNLAERALVPVLPTHEEFPYVIRLVSEVVSSNGSTSMASTCGSTLALMDAGVPIKAPVAGAAMGLVLNGETGEFKVLTDILGKEDAFGDMDFKVTGTTDGITALPMDIKVKGIDERVIREGLRKALEARLFILDKMTTVMPSARQEMSDFAPRITTIKINPEKIRDIIGKGGAMIRKIQEETHTEINVEDDGSVEIAAVSGENSRKAVDWINSLTRDVEVGSLYLGKVTRLMNFGAFVEILPGKEGLVRIGELSDSFVNSVEDVVSVGDEIMVVVTEVDRQGRTNLSRKAAMARHQAREPQD